MRKQKLKPGAEKKLRWIRRIAAVTATVAFILFLLIALQSEPNVWTVIQAAIVSASGAFCINVYEAANELLTGYIYTE